MNWCANRVVFRLRAPMHIGWGKVGNLQRTRPYVTGRVLWGALTMRLTRDAASGRGPATDSRAYQLVGEQVHQSLAFTYFYPATRSQVGYQVKWPWEDEYAFRSRLLSSYQGTALSYPAQSAATGMLHEVEFVSPNTLDTGEPVFLIGYIFEREDCQLAWRDALHRLQLGGERGYGWGDAEVAKVCEFTEDHQLYGNVVWVHEDRPQVRIPASGHLLAHAHPTHLAAQGEVEPLVGREWRSNNARHRHSGQHVEFCGLCFAPGTVVSAETKLGIGHLGVWEVVP